MAQNPAVRPTKRCLDDLHIAPPDLGRPLYEIDHPVVSASQTIPEKRDAGGAERIVSLSDRVWFKVKAGNHRAAVTHLGDDESAEGLPASIGAWWTGAAGHRQADSPQHDFYASLARECATGKTVSSTHLCPAGWDWKRLAGEQAVAWLGEMKRTVIRLIAMSLKTGQIAVATFKQHRIKALARADGGEAYLAIIAEGIPDSRIYAVLLDCVPGVPHDDWQPEPSPVASFDPAPGEVVWSTLLTPEVSRAVLELDETHTD